MRNRTEEQRRLVELHKQFLFEVEKGARWNQLRDLLQQIKEVTKGLDDIPGKYCII